MKVELVGAIVVILVVVSIVYATSISVPFKSGVTEEERKHLKPVNEVFRETASMLWKERVFDTIFQGVVIFSAVIAVLTLLRREKGG